MFISMTVNDAGGKTRGTARMKLDFNQNQWSIDSTNQLGWQGVGSNGGAFEYRPSNGVIWIWDKNPGERNPLIIWDSPTSENDSSHPGGGGRLYDPSDKSLKEGKISWQIDKAAPSSGTGLAPIRDRIVQVISEIPFSMWPHLKANFPNKAPATKPGAVKGKVTNCGEFPGYIMKNLGGSGIPEDVTNLKFKDQYGDYSVTAPMTAWDVWAKALEKKPGRGEGTVWIPSVGDKRPKPGDIYILYGWTDLQKRDAAGNLVWKKDSSGNEIVKKTPKGVEFRLPEMDKIYGFKHVGIIIDASGAVWKTADCGQSNGTPEGAGFSGCYNKKSFTPGSSTGMGKLSGDQKDKFGNLLLTPDNGVRDLKGWVDVENLFRGWKP